MQTSYTRSGHSSWNHSNLSFYSPRNRPLTAKDQILNGVAIVGIGSFLLVGSYLFLAQLASYGW